MHIEAVLHATVHSRYLGSKKPLGGFYHYINIGSFFIMFVDKYGISYRYAILSLINLCGVEDSVVNYQTNLISCCAVMVLESYKILFFYRFVNYISSSVMI